MNNYFHPIKALAAVSIMYCAASHSEVKEVRPAQNYCAKATRVSKSTAEDLASRKGISIRSLEFMKATPANPSGCWVTFDTPKGPQDCKVITVYSDGRDYWVGGMCV